MSNSHELPDAELELLACLDRLGEATARQLREALHDSRPMAHGSVLTLLKRLESKHLVSREKGPVGKAFVYRSSPESRRTFQSVTRGLTRRIFGGDPVAMVASLFESRPPDARELQRLRELVDSLEETAHDRTSNDGTLDDGVTNDGALDDGTVEDAR